MEVCVLLPSGGACCPRPPPGQGLRLATSSSHGAQGTRAVCAQWCWGTACRNRRESDRDRLSAAPHGPLPLVRGREAVGRRVAQGTVPLAHLCRPLSTRALCPAGVSPRRCPRCPHFLSPGRAGSGLLGHRQDQALSCKQSRLPLLPGYPTSDGRIAGHAFPGPACPMPGDILSPGQLAGLLAPPRPPGCAWGARLWGPWFWPSRAPCPRRAHVCPCLPHWAWRLFSLLSG